MNFDVSQQGESRIPTQKDSTPRPVVRRIDPVDDETAERADRRERFSRALAMAGDVAPACVPQTAEARLLLAVLEDAILCYQKHCLAKGGKHRALFIEAERWIDLGPLRPIDVFASFNDTCAVLGIDSDALRSALHAYRDRRRAGKAAPIANIHLHQTGLRSRCLPKRERKAA